MLVGETEKLPAETDGECLHSDAAPAADELVAHPVHENDKRQNRQEREQRTEDQTVTVDQFGECFAHLAFLCKIRDWFKSGVQLRSTHIGQRQRPPARPRDPSRHRGRGSSCRNP